MKVLGCVIGGCLSVALLQGCNLNEGVSELSVSEPVSKAQGFVGWPAVTSAVAHDPVLEARVAGLVAGLSLEEKVGQIIQPEIKFITPEQVLEFHIGSVLNGGGTSPNNDKFAPVTEWVKLADAYYNASVASNGSGIPLIWGSDAVHGHNNVVGATLFPHNIGLGAARDPALIKKIGAATAAEVAVTGIDWTFAPTVAVVRDDRWGRTYESYSEDPSVVREYASAMVEGVQGVDAQLFAGRHVVATAKHFLGDGGTTRGIDRGDTAVTEQELMDIHAAGFIAALESGVQTVMASFNSWNDVKMHGNAYLLTQVLKETMGFDGFVVGDWNGHRQVPGCTVIRCAAAINAGLDMFMVPSDWRLLYENTLEQARSGELNLARLDDAVTRIVRVKVRAGLMDKGIVSGRPFAAKPGVMGGDEHRALAREAVRKSLVLLKNDNALLPLSLKQTILVAGSGADNIGQQSGGWTLSWQGTGNTDSDFPGATSIYDALNASVSAAGGSAILSEAGTYEVKPDVAVVVIGEKPYAEWHGDISSIEYQYGVKDDLKLLQRLKADGIPVVTVFLSGRPLWVNKEINASDAFVAAWLPGSEGAGVTDVLLRDEKDQVAYEFTGKLSFSWPEFSYQTVLNLSDDNYAPLFPFGYGLNYQSPVVALGELNEKSEIPKDGKLDDAWLFVSRTMAPWDLFVGSGDGEPLVMDGNEQVAGINGNLKVLAVDKVSQQDARKIRWAGVESASAYLQARAPQDMSDYLEREGRLELAIKVNQAPLEPVFLGMACGDDCQVELPLGDYLTKIPAAQWQTLSVPLRCFSDKGMDFTAVQVPFSLSTAGGFDVSIADVKLLAGKAGQSTADDVFSLSCEG